MPLAMSFIIFEHAFVGVGQGWMRRFQRGYLDTQTLSHFLSLNEIITELSSSTWP